MVGKSHNEPDFRILFGQLVEQYQSPIRRYLFHLTSGDGQLADDLAQDTFVKAYTHYTACNSNVKSWLFRIAHNTFIDYLRTKKLTTSTDSLTNSYSGATHLEMLNETLSCLDDKERNLAILAYIEQLSHSDISEVTGIPLGSVKTVLKRTKQKLQQHLRNERL